MHQYTSIMTKYNAELVIATMQGVIESSVPIVSVGDTIGAETVAKCQAISFLPVGSTIHIYVNLGVTGGYKFYHTTYDISTGTLGSFGKCHMSKTELRRKPKRMGSSILLKVGLNTIIIHIVLLCSLITEIQELRILLIL